MSILNAFLAALNFGLAALGILEGFEPWVISINVFSGVFCALDSLQED
jgi:hypothetical protein